MHQAACYLTSCISFLLHKLAVEIGHWSAPETHLESPSTNERSINKEEWGGLDARPIKCLARIIHESRLIGSLLSFLGEYTPDHSIEYHPSENSNMVITPPPCAEIMLSTDQLSTANLVISISLQRAMKIVRVWNYWYYRNWRWFRY